MRRFLAVSLRRFALTAVICMLSGAAGCGRETFDLLPSAGAAGSVSGGAGLTSSSAGSGGSARGGAGGSARAGAGAGGNSASGGSFGFSGSAGRPTFPNDGGSSGSIGVGGGPASCSPSFPFCVPCTSEKDCNGLKCDLQLQLCYECQTNDECPSGEVCNLAKRCAKQCSDMNGCADDPDHRLCYVQAGMCVSCFQSQDCDFYITSSNMELKCFQQACVECTKASECGGQPCVAGRCQKPH